MKFIQVGLQHDRVGVITDLFSALYLDKIISKQQVRRALTRLCADFEILIELEI